MWSKLFITSCTFSFQPRSHFRSTITISPTVLPLTLLHKWTMFQLMLPAGLNSLWTSCLALFSTNPMFLPLSPMTEADPNDLASNTKNCRPHMEEDSAAQLLSSSAIICIYKRQHNGLLSNLPFHFWQYLQVGICIYCTFAKDKYGYVLIVVIAFE